MPEDFWLHLIAPKLFPDYSHPMINKKYFIKTNKVGFMLGAVLLAALANGVGTANAQTISVAVTPPSMQISDHIDAGQPVIQDNYVYYPGYAMYFNTSRNQYVYLNNGAWVWSSTPYGVTSEVLRASPSVRMDWHDLPAKHHADMVKRYPKDWKSDSSDHNNK